MVCGATKAPRAPPVAAEVDDPAVVGAAVGVGEAGVAHLGLPEEGEGGVEDRHIDALLVHPAQPGRRFHARGRGGARIAPVGIGVELVQGNAVAPELVELAAAARQWPAVDLEHFDAARVARHADRPVAVAGVDVALPQIRWLQHVGVGVDDR
jgi:hypothetical protein